MEVLRHSLLVLDSEKGNMMHYLLTHTHMYFDSLDRTEAIFKTNHTHRYKLEKDLIESKTCNDFLINFGKLKLLMNGYFSANNVLYTYDEKKKRFDIPRNAEKFIMISDSSYETTSGIFDKFVRVMLGLVEVRYIEKTLSRQTFTVFNEDFILPRDERNKIKEAMALL